MADLAQRLATLTPEKRALLERLLAEKAAAPDAAVAPEPEREPARLTLDLQLPAGDAEGIKEGFRQFYNRVSAQLNATDFGELSFFLNYGYVSNGGPDFAAVEPPEYYINRNSVRLVLEMIGDCPVEGRHVLDVGCGRGGTVHVLTTFFNPATATGLDLSAEAIAFCRRAHRDARVRFFEGDAEQLPFENGAFNIVTNLESSHSYPDINRFYAEVYRVLTPGGNFVYSDVMTPAQTTVSVGMLEYLGFVLERKRDITANVLISCDEIARHRVQAFAQDNDEALMNNFLGAPGSQVYEEMDSGRWTYFILKLRKPD